MSFTENELSKNSFSSFEIMLKKTKNLKNSVNDLNLSFNNLGNSFISFFYDFLKDKHVLININLRGNKIKTKGIHILIDLV